MEFKVYWNGEPGAIARRVRVQVPKAEKETYWYAELEGTVRRAVEITYHGQTFLLDDEDEQLGWRKVTWGLGDPQFGHKSLPDDSEVIEELSAEELEQLHLQLEAIQNAHLERVAARTRKPQTFREFHDELRKIRRRGFRRVETGTYIKPTAEGEIKGKLAIKAAKRERVRQMKAEQANSNQ